MISDLTIFADAAEALKIGAPAFVEKDYYAIQLLKLLNDLRSEDFRLIFCGGTCLSKAYHNTHRMSEDIDIKFSGINGLLSEPQRKNLRDTISDMIRASNIFELEEKPKINNRYRTQTFKINYPKFYNHAVIKPHLQLELVQCNIYDPTKEFPIQSLYTKAINLATKTTKHPAEIPSIICVNMESILIEKMIALLWRTAAAKKNERSDKDDELVRHIYDIHCLFNTKKNELDLSLLLKIYEASLKEHVERYGNKHKNFKNNPKNFLLSGLDKIQSDAICQNNYNNLLPPLIYNDNLPPWTEALETLNKLHQQLNLENNQP